MPRIVKTAKPKVQRKVRSIKTKAKAVKATARNRGGVTSVKAPPLLRDIFYNQYQIVFCRIVSVKVLDQKHGALQRYTCLMTLGRSQAYVQDTILSETGEQPRPGEAWKFHVRALEPGLKRIPVGVKV